MPAKIRLPTWPGKYTACPLLSDNLIAGSTAQRVDWLVSGVNYNQASSLKLKQAPSLVVGANASCFISAAKSGSLSAPVGL